MKSSARCDKSFTAALNTEKLLKSQLRSRVGGDLLASGDDTELPVPSVVHGATRCYHEVVLQYAQCGATRSGVELQDATTRCCVPQDATPPPLCPNQYKTLLPCVKCDDGVEVTLRATLFLVLS